MAKKNKQKNIQTLHEKPLGQTTVKKEVKNEQKKISDFAPGKYFAIGISIFLFAITLIINSNTFTHGFVLDDHGIIKNNKITKAPISWENTKTIFSTPLRKGDYSDLENSLYRPFTKFLFNIEWNVFNGKPEKFHVVNTILYALIGVFVFFIFYDVMKKKWVVPFLIALLFAVHPIHSEVVANVKSGDEILSLLGALIAIRCIQIYLKNNKTIYMVAGILAYLAGSFSKESTVVFVGIIPLFLYFFTDISYKKNAIISSIFLLCSLFFLACRHLSLSGYPPPSQLSALDNYLVLSNDNIPIRIASAINTVGLYIKTFFIPHPLSCDYSYASLECVKSFVDPTFLLSLLILIAALVFSILSIKKKNVISFGLLWFFVTFSITCNIFFLIGTSFGERLFFTPSLGLCAFTVFLLAKFLYKCKEEYDGKVMQGINTSPLLFAIIIIISGFYAGKTYSRNYDWRTDFALFSRDIEYYPNSTHLLFYLGNHLSGNEYAFGKTPEQVKQASLDAIAKLSKALSIYPALPSDGYNQLGKAYFNIKKYDSAEKYYAKAFSEDTTNSIFINNMGTIPYNTSEVYTEKGRMFQQMGNMDSANFYFLKGINRLMEALPYFHLAYTKDTNEADFMNNIGCIYGATQRPDSAIYWFEKAHRKEEDDLTSVNFLDITYRAIGNIQQADYYRNIANQIKAEKQRKME